MDTLEKIYCAGHDNNDARLELSQQKQNATLIEALKPATAAA